MTDLGTLNTAFPTIDPWFDLRPCLVNGWTAIGTQTCGVSAMHNLLYWSMRLNGDSASSSLFIREIPGNLRPPQNLPVTAYTSAGATYAIIQRSAGSIYFDAGGNALIPGWDRSGELIITGFTPRGRPA